MQVSAEHKNISFKFNPLINTTAFIEERLLINKALLDGARDVSIIVHANNKNEREERARKAGIVWVSAFATPFVTLPLTNRLGMKYVAKLTKSLLSQENNLIELSNKYLTSAKATKQGIEELSKLSDFSEFLKENDFNYEIIRQKLLKDNVIKRVNHKVIKLSKKYLKTAETTKQGIEELSKKYDFLNLLERNNHDYEKIRRKLINAKMAVLAFDLLFTTSLIGSVGFINRWKTRKKTGRDGFSAEFNMADKELVEKRAEKFKKTEKLRDIISIASVLLFSASPLLLRKGLLQGSGKLADFAKKYGTKFDYNDGIFMQRLPFFLITIVVDILQLMSTRNETEVKDQAVRLSATQATFFGGDIIIGSALAAASDKLFKTELLDNKCEKTWINKIIPPIKPIKELEGKNKAVATGLFWVNMVTLFSILGVGIPKMMNKIIKHDVDKDVNNQTK